VGAPASSGAADQDVSFLNFGGTFFNTAAYLLDGTMTRVSIGAVSSTFLQWTPCRVQDSDQRVTSQYGWSSGNVITS